MEEGYTPPGLDEILEGPANGQPRDDQGRFAPKPEPEPEVQETGEQAAPAEQPEPQTEVPPTPEAEPEPAQIPFKALKDERAKRQTLEQELAAIKAQLQQFQQPQQPQYQPQPEPQAAPDRWEDPEGYDRWLVNQAAATARAEALETMQVERVKQTAIAARNKYQDFDTAVATFQQLAAQNPQLEQMMLQQPDPAEWAYRTAKTHLEVSQYGSLEAAVEARVQAALEAKMAALQQQAAKPTVPPSLATERNAAPRSNPVAWQGPPSLESILNR